MGYAGLTPHGYERKRFVPDSVAIATRNLMPDVLSWSDKNIANWIDEITARAEEDEDNIEIFWRDDFADGVFQIRVIRIDDYWSAAHTPPRDDDYRLYAVIKDCEERISSGPTEIILTVVDEAGYEQALFSKLWLPARPETSRFRHPGEPEQKEEAMEEQYQELVSAPTTGRELEPLLISYIEYGKEEIIHSSKNNINTHIREILDRGTPTDSIQIWRRVKSTIRVVIEVED